MFTPFKPGDNLEEWAIRFSEWYATDPNLERLHSGVMRKKGDPPPNMTTTQRDAMSDPPVGYIIFNTSTGVHNFWNGTVWGAI